MIENIVGSSSKANWLYFPKTPRVRILIIPPSPTKQPGEIISAESPSGISRRPMMPACAAINPLKTNASASMTFMEEPSMLMLVKMLSKEDEMMQTLMMSFNDSSIHSM